MIRTLGEVVAVANAVVVAHVAGAAVVASEVVVAVATVVASEVVVAVATVVAAVILAEEVIVEDDFKRIKTNNLSNALSIYTLITWL